MKKKIRDGVPIILSKTVTTYIVLLLLILLLKSLGLDLFGIELDNPTVLSINSFITTYNLENVWYAISLYINIYIVLSIMCNDKSKKLKLYTLGIMPIAILIQVFKTSNILFILLDIIYIFTLGFIYKKGKLSKDNVLNYLIYFLVMNSLFQVISLSIRDVSFFNRISDNFILTMILSFDYILFKLIFHKLYFMKGGKSVWEMVHCYGLMLLKKLKDSLTKLQKSLLTKRAKMSKKDKVYYSMFIPFMILYNLATLVLILFIGYLFDAMVEISFITISFWINKGSFGEPFHAKSSKACFMTSSISYLIISKLALSIGVTLISQVIMGIMFSFITSLFVVKKDKLLYRGMTLDKFNEVIYLVEPNGSVNYKVCLDYYVNRYSQEKIAYKYNYSVDNIKKIKQRTINKLKDELVY